MSKNLVLGRGEVYFNRFIEGTMRGEGERYLGNTPSMRVKRVVERLDRATAYEGKRHYQKGAVIAETHDVEFVTDNVSVENIRMWFGGGRFAGQGAATERTTETLVVKRGRFYQAGTSKKPVIGSRQIDGVEMRRQGVEIAAARNFVVHKEQGRIEILPDAPDLPDDSYIEIDFDVRSSDETVITSTGDAVYGSLRFIARNVGTDQAGLQKDLFFPYVRIAPKGAVDLKGDEWQQWSFEATAMSIAAGQPQVYVVQSGSYVGYTLDEQDIIDELGSLGAFPPIEDDLDRSVNGYIFTGTEGWEYALDTSKWPNAGNNWNAFG